MKNSFGHKLISPLDVATILYIVLTGIYLCFGAASFAWLLPHLTVRGGMLLICIALMLLKSRFPQSKPVAFVKNLYPLLFLGFFYTETSSMKNIIFSNDLDAYFVNAEQRLWHCQPSMEFSKWITGNLFNELMNLCYFSYYLLIGAVCITLYFSRPLSARKNVFVVVFSFYLYYAIFAIFPTVGPQYYIHDTAPSIEPVYLFSKLMHYIVSHYEKPTGAFPSSHVGIAVVISMVTFRHHRQLFFITLPFVLGIFLDTVYLKEHYLVDVLAGIATAPLFVGISNKAYYALAAATGSRQNEAVTAGKPF